MQVSRRLIALGAASAVFFAACAGGGATPAPGSQAPSGPTIDWKACVAFDTGGQVTGATTIACGNDTLGIAVHAETGSPCDIWWASVDTVSLSEDGFERTHQGGGLTFVWPLRLAPGEAMSVLRSAARSAR